MSKDKDDNPLSGLGLTSILGGANVNIPHSTTPPALPEVFFDYLYSIPHPWDSASRECYKGTPFNTIRASFESTLLLPGEETYLRRRMMVAGIPWRYRDNIEGGVLLRLEETCPYCDNHPGLDCPAFDHLPVMRRCWPLRFLRTGSESISIHLSLHAVSTQGIRSIDAVIDNIIGEQWIGAWMDIARRIVDDEWWSQVNRSLPQGYLHLADLITPYDLDNLGIPRYALKQFANPDCARCEGTGVHGTRPCARCYTNGDLAHLLNAIQSPENVYRPRKT